MTNKPKIPDRRWTGQRQLAFLDTLAQTRCVTRAAASAGMSRESAYRLRRRPAGALFAAAWDRVMLGHSQYDRIRDPAEGNRRPGNLARLSNSSMS
jgi:hypothetical protein